MSRSHFDKLLEHFRLFDHRDNFLEQLAFLGNLVSLESSERDVNRVSFFDEGNIVVNNSRQQRWSLQNVIVDWIDPIEQGAETLRICRRKQSRRLVQLLSLGEKMRGSEKAVEGGRTGGEQEQGAFEGALHHLDEADAARCVVVGGDGILDVHFRWALSGHSGSLDGMRSFALEEAAAVFRRHLRNAKRDSDAFGVEADGSVVLQEVDEEPPQSVMLAVWAVRGVDGVVLQEGNDEERACEGADAAAIGLVEVALVEEILDQHDEVLCLGEFAEHFGDVFAVLLAVRGVDGDVDVERGDARGEFDERDAGLENDLGRVSFAESIESDLLLKGEKTVFDGRVSDVKDGHVDIGVGKNEASRDGAVNDGIAVGEEPSRDVGDLGFDETAKNDFTFGGTDVVVEIEDFLVKSDGIDGGVTVEVVADSRSLLFVDGSWRGELRLESRIGTRSTTNYCSVITCGVGGDGLGQE